MNNLIKAKILVELLDERKYSILSSFSSSELNKLNNINLDDLNKLSASEINNTLNECIKNIEKKIQETDEDDEILEPIKEVPKMKPKKKKEEKKSSISSKLMEQPPQLIACLLNKVDQEQKDLILKNLSNDQKALIETIQVDENPIFDTVIGTILSELELSPSS